MNRVKSPCSYFRLSKRLYHYRRSAYIDRKKSDCPTAKFPYLPFLYASKRQPCIRMSEVVLQNLASICHSSECIDFSIVSRLHSQTRYRVLLLQSSQFYC